MTEDDRNELAARLLVTENVVRDIGTELSRVYDELDTGRAQAAKDRLRTIITRCAWIAPP